MAQGVTLYAEDLADDARWPTFGPAATAAGVRSLLALPLLVPGVPGALNCYARYPRAFGVIDRGKALLLAGMAGLAYVRSGPTRTTSARPPTCTPRWPPAR